MPDLAFTRSFTRGPASRTITLRCRYAAPVADVWSALTEPERLARWFGAVIDPMPLDPLSLEPMAESGWVVLDVGGIPALVQVETCHPPGEDDAPSVLDMRWTWQGEPPTRVVLRLAGDHPGATDLTLEHSGLLVDSHVVGFGSGWEWSLTALAAELVGERRDEGELLEHQEVAHEVWREVYLRAE